MDDGRLICTACGAGLEVTGATPGGVVACPGCGKRIRLSRHLPAAEPTPDVPTAVGPPPPTPSPPWVRWAGLLAIGTAAATVTAVLAVRRGTPQQQAVVPGPPSVPHAAPAVTRPAPRPEPWDHAHRADLLRMESDADALAIDGDLRGAYAGYRQLLATAAEHDLTDPIATQVVTAARAAQDRVLTKLLAAPAPDAAAAVPPAVVVPPVVVVPPPTPTDALPRPTPPPAPSPTPPPAAAAVRLAADTAPALPAPPPSPSLRTYTPTDGVTDEQIGHAIDAAITWLRQTPSEMSQLNQLQQQMAAALANRRRGGFVQPPFVPPRPPAVPLTPRSPLMPDMTPPAGTPDAQVDSLEGETVLATYALLNAGRATEQKGLGVADPAVVAALAQVKAYPLVRTYTRSLRAATLAVYNRPEDRTVLEDDTRWLMRATVDGGYSYTGTPGPFFDNSNSQYGLLGVWAGAQSGIGVPAEYWRLVLKHWTTCATAEGTWATSRGRRRRHR